VVGKDSFQYVMKKLVIRNILPAGVFGTALIAMLLLLTFRAEAVVYYVSASGNDAHQGTSPGMAWKTLEKVNSLVPKPGDQILFNRGDSWEGSLSVNIWGMEGKPLIYGAYGTGSKPKIYGSKKIEGWTRHSGNIYKAKVSNSINQLFIDGNRIRPARWPNKGYANIDIKNGDVTLSSRSLNKSVDYTGAQWFGRTGVYHTEIRTVTSGRGGILTLDSPLKDNLDIDEGFILMGKLEFLDQPGEWYYDSNSQTVYLWAPKGDSPSGYEVRGSVFDYGLYSIHDYIQVQDLEFLHHAHTSIYTHGKKNIVIDQVDMMYPDRYGVFNTTTDKGNYIVNNSTVKGANHQGIHIRMPGITVTDCEISEIALFDHIGLSGNGEYYYGTALYAVGTGSQIRYNRIWRVGYNGIFFAGGNNVVEYNYIDQTNLLKGDGGGIYTTQPANAEPTTGSVVRYNIVKNTVGSSAGIKYRHFSNGIYIDESAHGVTVEYNTVFKSSDAGIKLHKVDASIVRNNTILDARYAIQILHSSGNTPTQIKNNIMYSTSNGCVDKYEPRQLLVRTSSANAVLENNIYRNPYESKGIFRGDKYCSFVEWKSLTGFDKNSVYDGNNLAPGEKEQLIYNDSKEVKIIQLGNKSYKDINGKKITGNITLQPFTSVILVGNNSEISVN
jgi:parallel beta-helix repeat protein